MFSIFCSYLWWEGSPEGVPPPGLPGELPPPPLPSAHHLVALLPVKACAHSPKQGGWINSCCLYHVYQGFLSSERSCQKFLLAAPSGFSKNTTNTAVTVFMCFLLLSSPRHYWLFTPPISDNTGFITGVPSGHSVGRVLSFFFQSSELGLSHLQPQASVPPPFGRGRGGGRTRLR